MAELDWKNPDDYAYLDDYNLHEWAWEFLRRNPEYRKAFAVMDKQATREMFRDFDRRAELWEMHIATTRPLRLYRDHLLEAFPDFEPLKPQTRQFRRGRFVLYVRILDAELARASIGEMGRVLFPSHKDARNSAKDVRETARQMATSGYRELLLLPPDQGDI